MTGTRTEFGDYAVMYGGLDYTGAVVLDIGADYGSTAQFFLQRGAAHVLASERKAASRDRLKRWAEGRPVTVLDPITAPPTHLFDPPPDIVKIDCEGCEVLFLGLLDEVLVRPKAWVVETHWDYVHAAFVSRFQALGYRVAVVCDWGPTPNRSGKVCRVLQAERAR